MSKAAQVFNMPKKESVKRIRIKSVKVHVPIQAGRNLETLFTREAFYIKYDETHSGVFLQSKEDKFFKKNGLIYVAAANIAYLIIEGSITDNES